MAQLISAQQSITRSEVHSLPKYLSSQFALQPTHHYCSFTSQEFASIKRSPI
jgi:hypothetical protein